jgi:chromosome segregation ATPase
MVPTPHHSVRPDHKIHAAILLPRDWTSPLGVSSPLYIFLGILITLCIAAPILSYQRHLRQSSLAEQTRRLRTAVDSAREKTTEVASLRAQQTGHEAAETELRNQLRDEKDRVRAGELRVESLEERERELESEMLDMGVTMEEVRTARRRAEEETGEVRTECETAKGKVGELEERLAQKEEGLWDLRRKFGLVNQEYLKLLNGEVNAERGAAL